MIRLLAALLIAFQAPAQAPPPAAAPGVFAAAVSPTAADNTPAIQAAHDLAADYAAAYAGRNPGFQARGFARLPAGDVVRMASPFYVDRPSVEVEGEGTGTKLAAAQGYAGPLVVVGVSRPRGSLAQYRPDLFGRLDATAAPAPGKRWGFRSLGNASLAMHGGVLDHGGVSPRFGQPTTDNWLETPHLTVDLAIEGFGPDGQVPGNVLIGSGGSPVTPWQFLTGGSGDFYVAVSYQVAPYGPPVNVRYRFDAPGPGVRRISFQIDTSGANGPAFAAWVDGAPTGPCTLYPNPGYPFVVCQTPGSAWINVGRPVSDVGFYGLALSRSLRYRIGPAGSAQARSDGQPITDAYRYFPASHTYLELSPVADTWALAHFPFDDDPAVPSRHLTVQGGVNAAFNQRSVAFLMEPAAAAGQGSGGQGSNAIRNLELSTGSYSGAAILYAGGVLNLTVEDVTAGGGGLYGIASLPTGASYPITLRRCTLQGTDAGFWGFRSLVRMQEVTWPNNGRAAIRTFGCSVSLTDGWVNSGSPGMESFFQGRPEEYGGNFIFRNVVVDNEDVGYGLAPIYCEAHPGGTSVRIEDLSLAEVGPVPAIRLRQVSAERQGWLEASMIGARGGTALVELDGKGWKASVTGSPVETSGPASVSLGTFGPATASIEGAPASPKTPALPD